MMSLQATTAVALILGSAALASGALMYWLRGGIRGGAPPSRRYLVWERSFIMAAVVLTAVGLMLLADLLAASDGAAMARAGAVAYLFGAVLVVAAEASSLGQGLHQDWSAQSWSLAVVYVVLALLAQATIGGALLAGDVLPAWIGWATLAWNIGWLAFYLLRGGDIYIPFVHHVMPFVIGVAVLLQGG
jgi:hypothetical protein